MASLPVRWMPLARRQAGEAQRWGVANRPAALLMLRDELVRVVDLIADQPRLGVPVHGRDARRVVLPRTGYVLFYRLRPRAQRIEVIAFLHGRRRGLP